MKQVGYLKDRSETPNARKFHIKALQKKISQRGLNRGQIVIKSELLPGITEKPMMTPKAVVRDIEDSRKVMAMLRNGRAFAKVRNSGLGGLTEMATPKNLVLAGAAAAAGWWWMNRNR